MNGDGEPAAAGWQVYRYRETLIEEAVWTLGEDIHITAVTQPSP